MFMALFFAHRIVSFKLIGMSDTQLSTFSGSSSMFFRSKYTQSLLDCSIALNFGGDSVQMASFIWLLFKKSVLGVVVFYR